MMTQATDTTKNKLAETALYYARCGWHVHPLKTREKTPLTTDGVHDATTDQDTIRQWWERWPGANIGLNCGASGLVVLDFDTDKPGFAGGELLENLRNNYPTTTAQSGSGGFHLLYQQPDGEPLGNGRGKLPTGVDVRGQGGYIVVAPSIHPNGNEYRWEVYPAQLPPQPLPAFLLDMLRPKAAQPAHTNGHHTNGNGAHYNGNAPTAAELVEMATRRAGADGRNNAGLWLACQLRDSGHGEAEAAGYMTDYQRAVERTKKEPYTEAEARETLRSGFSKPARSAWTPTTPPPWLAPLHTNGAGQAMNTDTPLSQTGPDEPTDGEAAKERFTDLGNARRFARLHGDKFRYVAQWGWLAWTGQRWEMDTTGAVMRAAKATAVGFYTEAAALLETAKRLGEQAGAEGLTDERRAALGESATKAAVTARAMTTWAKTCQGRARLEAMVKLAESELPIPAKIEDFNRDPWALNVGNGTVDLRTGRLRPHNPGDLLTTLAPVDYDPAATCPTWDKFLWRIMGGNQEMIDFLRRGTGYSLTGDVSEQKLFFAYGSGANGKSTLINALFLILGQDYAAQAAPELLVVGKDRHPTEVADLYGKRLVASIEVEDGRRLAENLVKQLTGGDKIKARLMRQDFFQFDPTHKLWLVANHKPVIKGTDYAIWRRIMLIPFTETIADSEKDPRLPDKLAKEAAGILAWAVRGCLDWQRVGLGIPDAVKQATADYREESDILAQFLSECTVGLDSARVRAGELYDAYRRWCEASGERALSQTALGRRLAGRGVPKEQNYQGVFYLGLGLI